MMEDNKDMIIKKGCMDLLYGGSRKKGYKTEALTKYEKKVFQGVLETHLSEIKDERKRLIVSRHLGINGFEKETRKEIGESMGISGSRVSQLERKGLLELFRSINPKWRAWIK